MPPGRVARVRRAILARRDIMQSPIAGAVPGEGDEPRGASPISMFESSRAKPSGSRLHDGLLGGPEPVEAAEKLRIVGGFEFLSFPDAEVSPGDVPGVEAGRFPRCRGPAARRP